MGSMILSTMRRRLHAFTFMLWLCAIPIVAQAAEEHADALVNGMISYVRWNPAVQQLNFCMVDGQAKYLSNDIFNPPSSLIRPNNVNVSHYSAGALLNNTNALNRCHILYFVNSADQTQQRIINASNKQALSISEQNQQCATGSAFCLYRSNQQYRFKINMYSLKQSHIQIDSKVLLLSKKYQGAE